MRRQKRGIIVLVLLLLAFSVHAPEPNDLGCYLYPTTQNDYYCQQITYAQAQEDCDLFQTCTQEELDARYFQPGACESLENYDEICAPVQCNVNCELDVPAGLCEALGEFESGGLLVGEPVNDAQNQCIAGCCVINNDQGCQITANEFECKLLGATGFGDPNAAQFQPGVTQAACLAQCPDAEQQDPNQQNPNAPEVQEPQGTASISGNVYVVEGENRQRFTDSATVFVEGPVVRSTQSDQQGQFTITDLPAGDYTLTASKVRYEQGAIRISLQDAQARENLELEIKRQEQQSVDGIAYIFDNLGQHTQGSVQIYINGVFRGSSTYDGSFSVPVNDLTPGEEYPVRARFGDEISYEFSGSVEILEGQAAQMGNVVLTRVIGECSPEGQNPNKAVEIFTASSVPGKPHVRLNWARPCEEVQGYVISYQDSVSSQERQAGVGSASILIEQDLEWGQTYVFSISPSYPQMVEAAPITSIEITLGSELCEDKFDENGRAMQFCSSENRKHLLICDVENRIQTQDCGAFDARGGNNFCAPGGDLGASCRALSACSVDAFGLFSSRDLCYGIRDVNEEPESFCYYDTATPQNSVASLSNQCTSCLTIESCFEYQSKDACQTNNCLAQNCKWVDGAAHDNELVNYDMLDLPSELPQFVTQETGAGYCVEQNYQDDDQCNLCGPSLATSLIYENNFCTADVCSALGRCFSNPNYAGPLFSECKSCGDVPTQVANCYTYATELECTGGQATSQSDNAQLLKSQDQCSWNRCTWLGGSCVKDGDGNAQDDCSDQSIPADQREFCKTDVIAPSTTLQTVGVPILALPTPNITVTSRDDFGLRSFHYCLTPVDEDTCLSFDQFNELEYESNWQEQDLTINLLEAFEEQINGQSMRLKYFSKDIFFNQEDVKTTFIFVDNVAPEFEVSTESQTNGRAANLQVYLEDITQERMDCDYALRSIIPQGDNHLLTIGPAIANKEGSFVGLRGIRYDLNVTCTDLQGNVGSDLLPLTFDLDENIEVTSPVGLHTTKIHDFSATTTSPASCQLFYVDSHQAVPQFIFVADMLTDVQSLTHTASGIDINQFYPAEYHEVSDYLISCEDSLSNEEFQEFSSFVYDVEPAHAQIILREGERQVEQAQDNFEEYFINMVEVSFACYNGQVGFECGEFYYCLEDLNSDCRGLATDSYTLANGAFTLNESKSICFYAKDSVDNQPYDIICGDINVNGFGITLLNPEQYIYDGDVWGVSSESEFTLEFFTRINTQECRFDFLPGFEYDDTPQIRVLEPYQPNTYRLEGFPVAAGTSAYPAEGGFYSLYLRCKDEQDIISDEMKVNLEYDPTNPNILRAEADPNPVVEGASTQLLVDTDDKTICKYDDRVDVTEFEAMQYTFPGGEDNILRTMHEVPFPIVFRGLTKDYTISTQCINGAGLVTEPTSFDFTVDYTQVGNIVRVFPSNSFINAFDLLAEVETSKNAFCEFRTNESYVAFDQSGGVRSHTTPFNALDEGYYQIPIRCTMAGNRVVQDQLSFTIDRTEPVINNVTDGVYSCGNDNVDILVYTNEQNISTYAYTVFDEGPQAGFANESDDDFAGRVQVANGSIQITNPFSLNVENYLDGHKYSVEVITTDAAGNTGAPALSDGFIITDDSYEICVDDTQGPKVTFQTNVTSCSTLSVEIHCDDELGCQDFKYGQSLSSFCSADLAYSGQKLSVSEPTYICYSVQDSKGNNVTGRQLHKLPDADGDGITDTCDECPNTYDGSVVDALGCADNEIPESESEKDSDSDRLPDRWEALYNNIECELDPLSVDSNANGIDDNEEDYDNDDYTNYEEYISRTDPCIADAPLPDPAIEDSDGGLDLDFDQPLDSGDDNTVAWILFVLGIVMVAGGVGYLIYFYKYQQGSNSQIGSSTVQSTSQSTKGATQDATKPQHHGLLDAFKDKINNLKKKRVQGAKQRARSEVFNEFNVSSKSIPHVEAFLQKKVPHQQRLQQMAKHYQQHKDEIDPGLRSKEKSLFARLDKIADDTKSKPIHEVASQEEAKDIFSKLRKLSKERKK